jgi:hypothetical protein
MVWKFLLQRNASAISWRAQVVSAPREQPTRRAVAVQKKLCTGRLCGRIFGLAEVQNDRIGVKRFAFAAATTPGSRHSRHLGASDFRFQF